MVLALWISLLAHAIGAIELPASFALPGNVFLTEAEAVAVRARCAEDPDAAAVREQLLAVADALVAESLEIPRAGGQWTHWYSCRKDGGRLEAESPTRHVCRDCGEVHSGWPYDDVYVTHRHHHWLGGVETLGWAYTLDPKPEYAARVRDILLEYATFYRELEQHDTRGNASVRGGRLFAQTLDESVDLCRISLGYDRVYRDLCFSAADHARIAEGLLRPMVETIRPHGAGISNWQTWHNAGVACAGFVLGDRDLVDWALNGKHGFFFQMHNGSVVESGMWYEESPSYHWYALRALVYLMEPATRAGIDLYADPMTRKLFTAPIRQLFPDLTFPALHDSNRDDIRAQRGLYAVAWARYQDPQFAALATPLDSPWALFWGGAPPYSGGMGIPPMGSDHGREARAMWFETSNEEGEGLAILRDVSGETAVFVDYGPGCSGHVQPAKLNLILFAHGDERFVDPGRLPYGNPLHGAWYRQTVAHNTVVVDGVSQRQGPGRLIAFRDTPSYALVHAAADKAYDGVRLERVVVLSRNVILDVFRCQSDVPRTYDLPLHTRGALEIATEPSPSGSENVLGTANGYELIEDTEQLPRDCREAVVATTAGRRIHVRWFDSADVFRGIGLGATPREKLPMLLRRQEGNEAVFAAVYTLLEAGETPPRCSFEHGAQRVVLRADDVALRLGQEAHVRVYGKSGRS